MHPSTHPSHPLLRSDLMWREIRELGKTKPIIASMADVAASGGYYMVRRHNTKARWHGEADARRGRGPAGDEAAPTAVQLNHPLPTRLQAMGCSKIVAERSTITGSIGVVTGKFNLAGLYEKLGYNKEVLSRYGWGAAGVVWAARAYAGPNIFAARAYAGLNIFAGAQPIREEPSAPGLAIFVSLDWPHNCTAFTSLLRRGRYAQLFAENKVGGQGAGAGFDWQFGVSNCNEGWQSLGASQHDVCRRRLSPLDTISWLLCPLLALQPFNEEEEALFDAAAQHAYESFRDKAAESRGMSIEAMQVRGWVGGWVGVVWVLAGWVWCGRLPSLSPNGCAGSERGWANTVYTRGLLVPST